MQVLNKSLVFLFVSDLKLILDLQKHLLTSVLRLLVSDVAQLLSGTCPDRLTASVSCSASFH